MNQILANLNSDLGDEFISAKVNKKYNETNNYVELQLSLAVLKENANILEVEYPDGPREKKKTIAILF